MIPIDILVKRFNINNPNLVITTLIDKDHQRQYLLYGKGHFSLFSTQEEALEEKEYLDETD